MARMRRSQLEAGWHHVFNRGARRLNVFGDDRDRERFLELLGAACGDGRILAYALMGNHYHLLVEAPTAQLSAVMKKLGENFTRWFNAKYGYDGPLFRSRYASKPITSPRYLRHAVRYIHANPVVDGLGDWSYRWSGHRGLLGLDPVPPWLATDTVELFGGAASYRRFVEGDVTEVGIETPSTDGVRVDTPHAVEIALGIGSAEELAVVAQGGRGLRNDIRSAVALLAAESTPWNSQRLAARYGYGSASSFRVAVKRARQRAETDRQFAALVDHGRRRLNRPRLAVEM